MSPAARFTAAAPRLALALVWLLLAAGCATSATEGGRQSLVTITGDERQIRERIALIREAILAENAEGIFRHGTPDWTFSAPVGKACDRAAYLARTTELFAQIEIESLETKVTSLEVRGDRADVGLTQKMVRVETDDTGRRVRWSVREQESHEWVKTADGWRVARVQAYHPQREKLPAP